MDKNLKELQNYLGLESEDQVKLYLILEEELTKMGDWGIKILTYLKSILSKNKNYTSEKDKKLYEDLLKSSLDLLKIELDNYKPTP